MRMAKSPRSTRRNSRAPAGFAEDAQPFQQQRKRATNVSIDEQLLIEAKSLGINLSQTLEDRLRELTKDERARRWKAENRAYFESFEKYIEEHGIFGEDFRTW